MKVKHNAEELKSGETMILTLADRNILDDKGEIIDDAEELENTLVVSLKLTCWSFHASHFLESSDTAQPTMQRADFGRTSSSTHPFKMHPLQGLTYCFRQIFRSLYFID